MSTKSWLSCARSESKSKRPSSAWNAWLAGVYAGGVVPRPGWRRRPSAADGLPEAKTKPRGPRRTPNNRHVLAVQQVLFARRQKAAERIFPAFLDGAGILSCL